MNNYNDMTALRRGKVDNLRDIYDFYNRTRPIIDPTIDVDKMNDMSGITMIGPRYRTTTTTTKADMDSDSDNDMDDDMMEMLEAIEDKKIRDDIETKRVEEESLNSRRLNKIHLNIEKIMTLPSVETELRLVELFSQIVDITDYQHENMKNYFLNNTINSAIYVEHRDAIVKLADELLSMCSHDSQMSPYIADILEIIART